MPLSTTNINKTQQEKSNLTNPGLVACYDIWPGNIAGLFYTGPGALTGRENRF